MWKLDKVTLVGRHAAGVTSVRISPEGQILSASLDRTVRVWNRPRPSSKTRTAFIRFARVRLYGKPVPASATALAINDKYLVCAMHNGIVDLYSPCGGELIRKLPNPQEGSAYRYNFHTVATHPANSGIIAGSNGGYLVVWSAADGEILWRQTGFRLINAVRFLRGGQFLMAHEWDPWIHVWDFQTKERVRFETSIMETSANWVTACPAPAGSRLDFVIATEDADESRLIGVNLDHPDPPWQGVADARVHDLCFLPGGRHLLSGGDSGVLELWDTVSHKAPQRLDLRSEAAFGGEFAADTGRKSNLILTTPTLDEESYPPWTIHSLDIAAGGSFAAFGLANGTVCRVELKR